MLCAVFATELFGQATEYGQINGTVTDQSGSVLVNARVTARNVATNIGQTALTNSAGQYRIFNLLPGQYTLRIEAPGFKAATIEPFILNVGQTLTQNSSLLVGSTTETVNVSAQEQLLEATTVGSTTVIQEKTIADLPLNGRNYTQLISLTPGANGTRINGQWADGNRFVLDGNNNTTILGASSAYVPNLDSIQEFSISSHSKSRMAVDGIPDFLNVGNFSTPYIIGSYATFTSSPVSITEALSWVTGRHTTKFGFNLSRKSFTNMAQGDHYFFNVSQTADPQNVGSTGIELASLLLGLPQSYSIGTGNYAEAFNNWSVYGEDEWKVRRDVVLSIGLRYDSFPTPNFLNGTIINDWDYKTGEYLIGGSKLPPPCNVSNAAPCIPGTGNLADLPNGNMIKLAKYPGIRYPIHDNFGPRLGVAWNALRNTVLRVGYGTYFDTESSTAQEAQNTFGTWPTNQSISGSVNAFGASPTTVAQIAQTNQAPITTGVPWGRNTYYWDPHKKDAMSQQWNFDIQHQFTKDFSLTTGYVGSIGSRLDLNIAANTSPTPGPGTPAQVNARRPFPFYGSDTLYGTDLGRNNYNALQVKAEKRFERGFSFLGSYTWSKISE